ncbi:MAG: SPASM domain-containing protein [Clostridia bacterium]|nr:SPASM domain-containing protein [Clostridia bacterium]
MPAKNVTVPDTGSLAATDALGRQTVSAGESEKKVGIFYFLWLGEHGTAGPYNNTAFVEAHPDAIESEEKWMEYGGGVLPQILNAVSVLKKYGVDFNILSVVDDRNAKEIESTWNYFKKHGFDYLQFIPYVDEGNGVSLSAEAYGEFLKKSFDLWYDDYMRGKYVSVRHIDNYIDIMLGRPPENCAMCGVCGSYFVAEANGDLYPCDFYCKDEYKLGSIFGAEPFAINETHRRFIAASEAIHPHCEGCKYYALCRGGCRRDRTDHDTKNRYCEAYCDFFDYAAERMLRVAQLLAYS